MSKRNENRRNENQQKTPSMPRSSIEPYRGGARWSQPRSIDDIFDQFKRSFDQLIEPFMPFTTGSIVSGRSFNEPVARAPLVDLVDNGDSFVVIAELPGFKKDEVNVEVNKDTLTISAEKNVESDNQGKDFVHRERAYSAFERRVVFPEEVVPDQVEGIMHDGVLELKVPKKEPSPGERTKKVQLK